MKQTLFLEFTFGVFASAFLLVSLSVQLSAGERRGAPFIEEETFFSKEMIEKTLPLERGEASESDIEKYAKFMNLPNSSDCALNNETSCFELVKAGREIENYVKNVKSSQYSKSILINFNKSSTFNSKMTTTFAAFVLSIISHRALIINAKDTSTQFINQQIIELSKTHKKIKPSKVIKGDFTFCCADIDDDADVIAVEEGLWIHSVYLHPNYSSHLIKAFGIHAAYYVGNYLFGQAILSANISEINESKSVGLIVTQGIGKIAKNDFIRRLSYCDIDASDVFLLYESSTDKEQVFLSNLKILLLSPHIYYALGSVTGYFGMSLSGKKGSVVAIKYNMCFDLQISQSGSIDHLFNPKKEFPYSTNNYFYVCGPNINEARFFARHLLW